MSIDNQSIQNILSRKFTTQVGGFHELEGMLVVEVTPQSSYELLSFLKNNDELKFNFLTDVCGVHYPDYEEERQFCVVYHLHSWYNNIRIRVKCYVSAANPEVESVVSLFPGANWQERETYDFFGIKFKNHPQLKRILNMDEMKSFPLRKEFPMEDQGRTDKDDRFFGRTGPNC